MRIRNVLTALAALLSLGLLAPAAVSAHVPSDVPANPGCSNVLINAETDDDGLLGDLLEEDDEEATRARVCLDQAFEDVRSGNRAANDTDDNDDGLLGGLFGDDTDDNDDGLLGGLFGDDTDDNDDGLLGGL